MLLSVSEYATMCGVTNRRVYQWIDDKIIIPAYKKEGKNKVYHYYIDNEKYPPSRPERKNARCSIVIYDDIFEEEED